MSFKERLEELHNTPDCALRLEVNNFWTQYKDRENHDWYQDILDFHQTMKHHIGAFPCIPSEKVQRLRRKLIREETNELLDGIDDNDLKAIADGCTDAIVVTIGTAISYGIDLRPIWDEVHRTNMLKAGGGKRADGKSLKPADWQPPRIEELLAAQRKIS